MDKTNNKTDNYLSDKPNATFYRLRNKLGVTYGRAVPLITRDFAALKTHTDDRPTHIHAGTQNTYIHTYINIDISNKIGIYLSDESKPIFTEQTKLYVWTGRIFIDEETQGL